MDSDDDMWASSPDEPSAPVETAFELRRSQQPLKITVDVPGLNLQPANLACGCSASCDCRDRLEAGMRMQTHVYRSGGGATTSRFVGPRSAFYLLPTRALRSVLPSGAPLAETDISGCSINARAHVLRLTGADEAAEFLGNGFIDLRDRLAQELSDKLGDGLDAWLSAHNVPYERAGKELTKALAGSVSPMSFVTVTGETSHPAGPIGPLQDLVMLPSGLELCVAWHLSVCHLMMHAVYGDRFRPNFVKPLAALVDVYDIVVSGDVGREDEDVEAAAALLAEYCTAADGHHPFDLDQDGPGDSFADYLFLAVPPKHFRSRNRDYYTKAIKYVNVHNAVPASVLNAATTFHTWYDALPQAGNCDQLQLLATIAKRDDVNRAKLQRLQGELSSATNESQKARLKSACTKLKHADPLAGSLCELGYANFEAPLVKKMAERVGQKVGARIASVNFDAIKWIPNTAAEANRFERVANAIDYTDLSPFAHVHAECDAVEGDADYTNARSSKRRKTSDEPTKSEIRDQHIRDIKELSIGFAEDRGLIRVRSGDQPAVVHWKQDPFPECIYTEFQSVAGGVVGEVVTPPDFFNMVLSERGANGAVQRPDLLATWQTDGDGLDSAVKEKLYTWLRMTHHDRFPIVQSSTTSRMTWVPLLASEEEEQSGARTGLLSVIALMKVAAEICDQYGFGEVEQSTQALNDARHRYWFLDTGPTPMCPDRGGNRPPIITNTSHCDKRMPNRLSLDLRVMEVFGVMFPHMFEFKREDGSIATHLSEAAGITDYQWQTMLLTVGILGMGCVPGIKSPKTLFMTSGAPECGKSLVGYAIASWVGLKETATLQQTKRGGDKFTLESVDAGGHFKWFFLVDDCKIPIDSLLSDWKQIVTGGMFTFQRKNGHLKTANMLTPARISQSQQDFGSSAGFLYLSCNHIDEVFGGGEDVGIKRRIFNIHFNKERRPAIINPLIEEMAQGRNGQHCISEILVAIVAAGMAGHISTTKNTPVIHLVPDPDHPNYLSYAQQQQDLFIDRLQGLKLAEYGDFFSCLDHFPCSNPWDDGGAVDFNTLFRAVQQINPKAKRTEFKEAIGQHFASTSTQLCPVIVMDHQKCCSHVEMGTGCRHKFRAACRQGQCTNAKDTKATVVLNVKYVPTF